MSLNRSTQPGPVSPGGGEQAQMHKQASLSSESGESLRHVGCYPTVVASGGGMRRSEEARVSEEAVRRKGGGGGPRELGMG
jgi:hypothetical protein